MTDLYKYAANRSTTQEEREQVRLPALLPQIETKMTKCESCGFLYYQHDSEKCRKDIANWCDDEFTIEY